MAITQNTFTGNGSNLGPFSFTFKWLEPTDIKVTVGGVLKTAGTHYNLQGLNYTTKDGGQVLFTAGNAPANGAAIVIYRRTDTESSQATYYPGSAIRSQDLNDNNTQVLYSVQEWQTQAVNIYDPYIANNLDARNNTIYNLKEPTLAQDVATKNYVDTTTVASSGDSMTGPLAMGTNKVTGVGEPTSSQDAATKNYVDSTTWNNSSETIDSTEVWTSSDSAIGTTAATTNEMDLRHDTLVQLTTPAGSSWQRGKTWLQNDVNRTLSVWNGSSWLSVASGGSFTVQPTVIYVDSVNGDDANDGHRIINPKKTIKAAVSAANAGDIIKVSPGVYQEVLPIDITVANLSIVGDSQRSCFVHPTPATETQIMFRCNSGTYIDGFTFVGLKATGSRGGHPIDSDATYGLPTNQGWVAGFYPGCSIKKSPYINNCSNFADSAINNAAFDPNNYSGTGGDTTSGPTGGGVIVDGSVPSVSSPLRSFVVNEFTQLCLDGPGLLVCNNGYAQAVSFFGLFCHYHAKALTGGQINMEVGTTDFGRYGLIADGKSSSAIFTATANGSAIAGATTFVINNPTASGSWFGNARRPAINMLVQIGSDIYPILSSSTNGSGWNVTISRPNPSNRGENLGLINGHSNGATVSFFLRSMVSTASHTMEYAGSGCNYNALPENGGVPIEANESINRNNGKVWLTSTDQSGKFKVGDTFQVDQQTGLVGIDPSSPIAINIVGDLSPELGGDLDTLNRRIYSSTSPDITIGNPLKETVSSVAYPVVSQIDIGIDPNQVPLNQYLGTMAFQDEVAISVGSALLDPGSASVPAIGIAGSPGTGLYSPASNQLGFASAGVERALINSTGYLSGTVNGLGSGLYEAYQYYRLNATRLISSSTSVQSLLGVGVTLVGNTVYEFEGYFPLTKPSGTTNSHTVSMVFGGTATLNNINYDSYTTDSGSTSGALGTRIATINRVSAGVATATVLTGAISTSTANSAIIRVRGTVSINAGGTFIPQVQFSAAPGNNYTANIGSYFRIAPISAAGANTSIGTWA